MPLTLVDVQIRKTLCLTATLIHTCRSEQVTVKAKEQLAILLEI